MESSCSIPERGAYGRGADESREQVTRFVHTQRLLHSALEIDTRLFPSLLCINHRNYNKLRTSSHTQEGSAYILMMTKDMLDHLPKNISVKQTLIQLRFFIEFIGSDIG